MAETMLKDELAKIKAEKSRSKLTLGEKIMALEAVLERAREIDAAPGTKRNKARSIVRQRQGTQ